jgi:hypothetical protein
LDRVGSANGRFVFALPAAKCRASAIGAGLRGPNPANPRRTRTSASRKPATEIFGDLPLSLGLDPIAGIVPSQIRLSLVTVFSQGSGADLDVKFFPLAWGKRD